MSVSGFSFNLLQNRWSYLLPVVPLGQGGRFLGILKPSKGSFFSCASAAVGEPNWAIATAARAVEAVTSPKNALRVCFLLPVPTLIGFLLVLLCVRIRVVSVLATHGKAGLASFADAVEAIVGIAEVPAAVELADIATDGPHFPDMWRGCPMSGLGQRLVPSPDDRAFGNILQSGQSAYSQQISFLLDVVQPGNAFEVNHNLRVGRENLKPQCAQQISAAGNYCGIPFCISAAASSSVLAFTCANFFHVFIVLLLYLSQSFEDFVRGGGKVKDPFADCVVYGGRGDSGKARADVFAHA